MDVRKSFKWTILYRAITIGSLVAGLALVAAGFVVGFGGALTELFADPLNPGSSIEQANPTVTLLFVALGVVVWQLGRTYALFVTLPRAAGRAAGRQLDATHLASEVHDSLDDRLAALEVEIEETRRAVRELEDDAELATFDERDHIEDDETPALESGATETETASLSSSSPSDPTQPDGTTDVATGTDGDDDTNDTDETGGNRENGEQSDATADGDERDGESDPLA